jgi:hypothetical protein
LKLDFYILDKPVEKHKTLIKKKEGTLTEKMKIPPDERHT